MHKKALRLLLPLLFVSTLYFVLQQLTPNTNTKMPWADIWQIYVFPYNHFWFLQAIFLIFALMAFLEIRGALANLNRYLVFFALALALHFVAAPDPNLFSYRQALYLLPFFAAGAAACRFREQLWKRPFGLTVLWIFVICFAYQILATFEIFGVRAGDRSVFATVLGLSAGFAAMYWMPLIGWLRWLGTFSFTVYLYHVFFTAGTRIALNRFGIDELPVHFVLGWFAGVIGPVCVDLVLRRNVLARKCLLGQP